MVFLRTSEKNGKDSAFYFVFGLFVYDVFFVMFITALYHMTFCFVQ